jgi:hypothetical protein
MNIEFKKAVEIAIKKGTKVGRRKMKEMNQFEL